MHSKSILSSFILGLQIKLFYCCCRWKGCLVLAGHRSTAVYFCVRLCSREDVRSSQTTCWRHTGSQSLGTTQGQPWQGVARRSTPRLTCCPPPSSSLGPWCPPATLEVGSGSRMQFNLQRPAHTPRTHPWPPPSDQTGWLHVKLPRLTGEAYHKQHFFFFSLLSFALDSVSLCLLHECLSSSNSQQENKRSASAPDKSHTAVPQRLQWDVALVNVHLF